MVFLPKGTKKDVVDTYTAAYEKVKAHADFAKIPKKRLGIYPQMTGAKAAGALKQATSVPASAKAYVTDWLKKRRAVSKS